MKKIINGKVYDTDKAREMGSNSGGDGINKWAETLYQKRTGEFFLHGEGGPATKYAVSTGLNNWKGGEKIIPLDVGAVKEWVEGNLSVEEYDKIFGLPDDDAGTVTISAKIPTALIARARQKAQSEGVSLTAIIEAALQQHV